VLAPGTPHAAGLQPGRPDGLERGTSGPSLAGGFPGVKDAGWRDAGWRRGLASIGGLDASSSARVLGQLINADSGANCRAAV
jgi:hypothetical protein